MTDDARGTGRLGVAGVRHSGVSRAPLIIGLGLCFHREKYSDWCKATSNMSERRNFEWGRWIRASVAHHYLAVDRNWFRKHVRPYVPVIVLSTQARAYRKRDVYARAEQIESSLHQPIDWDADPSRHNVGNGRPIVEKGARKTPLVPAFATAFGIHQPVSSLLQSPIAGVLSGV